MDERKIISFDQVYVITLESRQDRLSTFLNNLPHPWILGEVKVFNGIDGQTQKTPLWWTSGKGAWGCYQSHLQIIKQCLDSNIDSLLILEDDAIFCQDFNNKCQIFLSSLPKDWEMLYLGGQHLKMPQQVVINRTVSIGTNINRTHAYGLKNNGLNKVYNWLCNTEDWINGHHIDHHYGRLHESKDIIPYCPLYWMVGQNEGLSNVSRKRTSTRWWN